MALQVSKNIQALADAAEEKRRQQEQGFAPSAPSQNEQAMASPMSRLSPEQQWVKDNPSQVNSYAGAIDPNYMTRDPYMSGEASDHRRSAEDFLKSKSVDAKFDKLAERILGPNLGPNGGIQSWLSDTGNSMFTGGAAMLGAPEALAGLGLGGGFVASQVGGQASTSSKLSPFAQQVAAADTARLNPPINAPKSNPILGRNVPTNPLNPSVGPMTKQPSLTAAQEAASRAAEETARRGPSAMAKISQFVDNALSGASKFARAVNIPSLLLTPNSMGDSTLTGNNIILSPFEQMATDNYRARMAAGESAQQYQAMIEQGGLMDPPSAAEAGDNLINIGNSLFPNEAPVNLMTQGGLEDVSQAYPFNASTQAETQKSRRAKPFGTTPTEPTFPQLEFSQTDTGRGRGRRGADLTMREKLEAIDMTQPAPSVNETTATANTTPTDGMDITQRAMTEAMDRTAETNAQRAELSPAQQNFLTRKEKGTPLEPWEILDAQKYAVSQGQIFDPETGYSQAEFYGQRYKGQSIGDYLRGADTQGGATEQFVDPQGRLRRSPEYSSYERESAAREARLEARPDFMKARPSQARKDGVMSMAQAVKVAGGNRKKAAAMIELQKMGRDPLTGQPEEPEGMTEYQTETLRQNQERIDFAKEEAEAARKAAEAKGATQAQRDAFEMKQKELNYAITYQNFLKDQEDTVFDAKDIEADLDSISDQLDIIYDPESGVFRRGKIWGKGEVIKVDDPKNASIVKTIGTYKVGKALLDKYPKKG